VKFLSTPVHFIPILLISHSPRTLPTWMTFNWIECIIPQRAVSKRQSFGLLGHDQWYSLNECFRENNSESHVIPTAVLMKRPCPGHVKMAVYGKGTGEVYVLSWQTSKRFPAIITVLSHMIPFASHSQVGHSMSVWFNVVIPLISCYSCHIGAKMLKRWQQCNRVPTWMAATNRC